MNWCGINQRAATGDATNIDLSSSGSRPNATDINIYIYIHPQNMIIESRPRERSGCCAGVTSRAGFTERSADEKSRVVT